MVARIVRILCFTVLALLCEGTHGACAAKTDVSMFDDEFFPTPKKVVAQMLDALPLDAEEDDDADETTPKRLRGVLRRSAIQDMLILDPSAGSGSMLDAVYDLVYDPNGWGRRSKDKLHAIEPNPELRGILKEKEFTLVGDDFLSFRPTLHYDLVLMNPPFSNGDAHLLHAWDILHEGHVVCLLNANTVKLPYTQQRKRLKALIEEHGSVTYLGPVFAQAARKTNVDVALVYLKKEDMSRKFDFMDDDKLEREFEDPRTFDFDPDNLNTPAVNDVVKTYVEQFNRARQEFIQYMKARRRMERAAALFHDGRGSGLHESVNDICRRGHPKHQFNAFTSKLQEMAWGLVMNQTKLADLMTETVRNNFERMKKEQGAYAFTEPNIHALFEMLFMNRYEILKQSLVDAFDKMTRYHRHNRLQEGWATNDAFKVNRKVIMPGAVEFDYSGGMRLKWDYAHTINDVDRGLAMLNGKRLGQVHTASNALEAHFKTYKYNKGALENNVVECEHFMIRFFKKGTVHLWFRDEALWERFNIAAAQGKNWLPMDYTWEGDKAEKNDEPAAGRAAQLMLEA